MKVEKEVRECDRCNALYPIWWGLDGIDGPDYKLTYLEKTYDLCPECYNTLTSWLGEKIRTGMERRGTGV